MYPPPYSLAQLSPTMEGRLIAVGTPATLSVVSTIVVLALIAYRSEPWNTQNKRKHSTSHDQCVTLITNLLAADFIQGLGFCLALHWIQVGGILAPTAACWVQAACIHLGDVASGCFVLAIAVHTFIIVVLGSRPKQIWIYTTVASMWIFALVVTIAGPLSHGRDFFVRAGDWCWISQKYDVDRLALHYVWVFIFEFGSILLYGAVFIFLRRRLTRSTTAGAPSSASSRLARACKFMIIYPVIYVILTLPLAVGRMMTMAGHQPSDTFFAAAGAMITSCGFMDSLAYTLTRNVLSAPDEGTYGTQSHSRHTGNIELSNVSVSATRHDAYPSSVSHKSDGKVEYSVSDEELLDTRST